MVRTPGQYRNNEKIELIPRKLEIQKNMSNTLETKTIKSGGSENDINKKRVDDRNEKWSNEIFQSH